MRLLILSLVPFLLAGINASEAEKVRAASDPAAAVKLAAETEVYVVTVKKILNKGTPTNGQPPLVRVRIERTLRGKPFDESNYLVWLPLPRGTIDWNCDSKCREDHLNSWADSPAQTPAVGEKYLVCVAKKRQDFVVPFYCRFPATEANLKAVDAGLKASPK